MVIELMKRFTKKQFKKEYYKQHPDGNDRHMEYYWRLYLNNKVTEFK